MKLLFSVLVTLLIAPFSAHAEDVKAIINATMESAKQELDATYRKLGSPAGRDMQTMADIQKASGDALMKKVWGKNGLNLSTSALPGKIRIFVAYKGESSKEEWHPPVN